MAYTSEPLVNKALYELSKLKYTNASLTSPSDVKEIVKSMMAVGVGQFYEIEPAEVLDIILDRFHPEFKKEGGWASIGKIKARLLYSEKNKNANNLNWISPLSNGIIKYPILHEIVLTLHGPAKNALLSPNATNLYYIPNPINIFNNVSANSFSNISIDYNTKKAPEDSNENYQNSQSGNNNVDPVDPLKENTLDNPNKDFLGNYFNRNHSIHSLIPHEGDTIIEGRFGQSIRMGSTVKFADNSPNISGGGKMPNWWSEIGKSGDPILIIRNGQSKDAFETKAGTFILEDFDNDGSSIYLTSGQSIHFKPASKKMKTWENKHPWTSLSGESKRDYQFTGNQILFNSDRIVMNARQYEIMMYSGRGISLSTDGDVHINCRSFKVSALETHNSNGSSSDDTTIGTKNEPAVLGTQLTEFINKFTDAICKLRFPGAPGSIDPTSATELGNVLTNYLDKLLSKKQFLPPETGMEINKT